MIIQKVKSILANLRSILTTIFSFRQNVSKKNLQYYKLQSRRYSKNVNETKPILSFPENLLRFLENLNCETILDIGCGDGSELEFLTLRSGSTGHGVEPDRLAVKRLQAKYRNTNMKFLKASATSLKIRDKSFDLVMLSSVLHWIEPNDYLTAISEACRVSNKYLLVMDFYHINPIAIPNIHHQNHFTYRRNFGDPILSTGEFHVIFESFFRKSKSRTGWEILEKEDLQDISVSYLDFELRRAVIFQRIDFPRMSREFFTQKIN